MLNRTAQGVKQPAAIAVTDEGGTRLGMLTTADTVGVGEEE